MKLIGSQTANRGPSPIEGLSLQRAESLIRETFCKHLDYFPTWRTLSKRAWKCCMTTGCLRPPSIMEKKTKLVFSDRYIMQLMLERIKQEKKGIKKTTNRQYFPCSSSEKSHKLWISVPGVRTLQDWAVNGHLQTLRIRMQWKSEASAQAGSRNNIL